MKVSKNTCIRLMVSPVVATSMLATAIGGACGAGMPAMAMPDNTSTVPNIESPEAAVPLQAIVSPEMAVSPQAPQTDQDSPFKPVDMSDLDRTAAKMMGSSPDLPSPEVVAPITLNPDKPPPSGHEMASTLQLNPIYLSRPIQLSPYSSLRQETAVDQEITLKEAINYVLDQGMQIKISRESMNYQRWLTASGVVAFLPSFFMQYNLNHANVLNQNTTSLAKTFLTGVYIPVFQGGGVLYSLLGQRYREKAWREAYKATVSDVYLDVYQKYNNLVLQRVLLQTNAKAVEVDEEQLKLAKANMMYGTGTRFDVMQVEALLAQDRQAYLQQSVAMRQAALTLSLALNYPMTINLIPAEKTLSEAPLFDRNVQLRALLQDAFQYCPGMRQYEFFRQSAARNIQVAASSLYPTVAFFITYQTNDASVNPPGNGGALGGAASAAIANFLDTSFVGRVSNNALGQQYTFNPTAGSTSTQGANTGPSAMPAASGGTPIAQVQSGSLVSSGAVAPSIFGGGSGGGSGPNANGSFQAPAGIFPGHFREVQAGFALTWSLPGLGMQSTAAMLAAKTLARQALMQCNQELGVVAQNVRNDYLSVLSARESIDTAAATTASTREALRLSLVRVTKGVATRLDWIRAQHDYIAALTKQAQAIVNSNVAQAQLLHDMGMISSTTLTRGYKAGAFVPDAPTGVKPWKRP